MILYILLYNQNGLTWVLLLA